MAKSQYESKVVPNILKIGAWARDGLDNEQIRKNLGIGKTTWYKYVNTHSELSELLNKNREITDITVENSLYQKCVGFKVKVKKQVKLKSVSYNRDGKRVEKEKLEWAEEEQYIPPDLGAQCFWLTNRKPETWKNRRNDTMIDLDDNETGILCITKRRQEPEDEPET